MEKEGLGLLGSFRYFLKGWATPVEVFEDTPVLNTYTSVIVRGID